jgi:hypothetical protein
MGPNDEIFLKRQLNRVYNRYLCPIRLSRSSNAKETSFQSLAGKLFWRDSAPPQASHDFPTPFWTFLSTGD